MEVSSVPSKYGFFAPGVRAEIEAFSQYEALQKGLQQYPVRKAHRGLVAVVLIESGGEVVEIDPASLN